MREIRAQLRPSDTNAAPLYQVTGTAPAGQILEGRAGEGLLRCCNQTTSAATCRVMFKRDKVDFDEESAVVWDFSVPANETLIICTPALLDDRWQIAVRSGTNSAITFTYEAPSA